MGNRWGFPNMGGVGSRLALTELLEDSEPEIKKLNI